MFAFTGFFITLSLLIERVSVAAAFGMAILIALIVQGTSLWILSQRHPQ
jgi:hypothetical protein